MEFVTPTSCTFSNFQAANAIDSLITPILSTLLFVMNTILLIIDMILFIKGNGCKIISYFVTDDPYGFRIEFIINSIIVFISGLSNLYRLEFYFGNARTDPNAIQQGITALD
eukprot:gene9001-1100_t